MTERMVHDYDDNIQIDEGLGVLATAATWSLAISSEAANTVDQFGKLFYEELRTYWTQLSSPARPNYRRQL